MFDFSLGELLLVATIAVVCLKPEDLPVLIKQLAKAYQQLKETVAELRDAAHDLADEVGFKEAQRQFDFESKRILGDDGQEYDAYDVEGVEAMVAVEKSSLYEGEDLGGGQLPQPSNEVIETSLPTSPLSGGRS